MPLEHAGKSWAVRVIALRRRRSRVPWIYLVYHAGRARPSAPATREAPRLSQLGPPVADSPAPEVWER